MCIRDRPLYAAVVDALDQAIGEILLSIEEAGIEEETIIPVSYTHLTLPTKRIV